MNQHPAVPFLVESLEPRLAPAGIVTLTLVNGSLTIAGDTQANDLQITDAGGGTWMVSAPAGGTTEFSFNGGPLLPTAVFAAPKTVRATLGSGDDRLDMIGPQMTGALTINGNDGNDSLLLSGTTVNGAVTIDTGNGDDTVDFTSTHFATTATVRMGTGDDYLTAGGNLYFGRGWTGDLGSGDNTLDVNADTLDATGNILISASGNAVETQGFLLAVGSGQVTGSVTLRTSTASDTDFQVGSLAGDDFRVSGGLTLQAGGGRDHVTLNEKIQVGGTLSISLSNGANEVVTTGLDTLRVGAFAYSGGTGDDGVTLNGNSVQIAGLIRYTGGSGNNFLDLNPAVQLRIGGAVSYNGGAYDDTLLIDGPDAGIGGGVSFNGSNGSNYLGFNAVLGSAGSLSYSGGTGTDVVDVGEFNGATDLVTLHGLVSIRTGSGSSDIMIRDAVLMGNLSVTTSVQFGGIDTLQILDSDVYGTTSVNMVGAADSDVNVRDSIFDRAVTVSTGGGDDYVGFDVDTAVSSIYSQFYGPVKVLLGAGNDIFAAGSNPAVDTVGNDFYSYCDVNGGAGYDRAYFIHYDYNNGFNGPLPWTNCEEYY